MRAGFAKQSLVLSLAMVVLCLTVSDAFAVCSSPGGNPGDLFYSSISNVMVYCNGTNWIAMGQNAAISFGTLTSGDFCTATSGTAISCNTATVNLGSQASGTLLAGQFPALTGDVTNTAGSLATTVGSIGGKTVSLGSSFTTSGAYGVTLTATATTSITLPTSGTVVATATSSPAQGDLLYYNGSAWTDLAHGTSGQYLQTQGAAAAQWASVTIGTGSLTGTVQVFQGGTGDTSLTAHGLLVGEGSTSPANVTAAGTAGQLLVGQSASTDPAFETVSGDVTIGSSGATTIAANAVSNSKFRQSAALSVVGNGTNAAANVADITGTANQALVVNSGGTALAFGAVNLASSSAVTGVLPGANGGTGVANTGDTITLGGNVSLGSSFTTTPANALTLTTTAATNVTLPTSGTLVNTAVTTLSSLVSIGTVTTGTWNGTQIGVGYGGTGLTAGISGGIPYFSSTSAMTSSALLASGSLMVGGGAGGAPATVTLGGDCTFASPNITCAKTGGTSFGALATLGVGTGLTSSGGNLNLTTPVAIANGGTGAATVTAYTVFGNNSSSTAAPAFQTSLALSGTMETLQSIGTTSSDGVMLYNTTAATSSAPQFSPRVHFSGQGWKTNATAGTQAVDFIQELQPTVTGTSTATGNLVWSASIGTGSLNPLMTLTSGGNVGIGTTSPNALFDVYAATPSEFIDASANGQASLYLANASVAKAAFYKPSSSSDARIWVSGAGDVMTFQNSTGNVGIGTTSPNTNALLQVYSTTKGFLPPLLTTAQETAMGTSLPTGLVVYNTDSTHNELESWNGTAWEAVGANSIDAGGAPTDVQYQNSSGDLAGDSGFTYATGSGAVAVGTSVTSPTVIGGTTASSTLTLESTSGTGTSDSIKFKTGSQSTAMTILSEGGGSPGYVGIGTTSPNELLNIYSSAGDTNLELTGTSPSLRIKDTVPPTSVNMVIGGATGATNWLTNSVLGDMVINNIKPNGILFGTNNAEAMRISSSGNVGIGSTAPGQKLTVVDAGNINQFSGTLAVFANNLTQGVGIGYSGIQALGSNANQELDLNARGTGNIFLQDAGGTGNVIVASGNVGIGTTSPAAKLSFGTSAGFDGIHLYNDGSYKSGFGITSNTLNLYTGGTTIAFGHSVASGASSMTADMSIVNGSVGIGSTSPRSLLDVAGSVYSNNLLLQGDNSNAYIRPINSGSGLNLGAANTNIVLIGSNGSVTQTTGTQYSGYVLNNGTNNVGIISGQSSSNDNGRMLLLNGGTTEVALSASGSSYINGGSVGIGTTSPQNIFHVQEGGAGSYALIQGGVAGGDGTALTSSNTIPVTTGNGFYGYNGMVLMPKIWGGTSTADAHNVLYIGGDELNSGFPSASLAFANWGYFTSVGTSAGGLGNAIAQGDAIKFDIALTNLGSAFNQALYFNSRSASNTTTTAMSILSNGNVGIGSTSPTQKLDVSGNINLGNGTSNTIFFGTNGVAAPGSSSAGEKIQLYGTAGTVGAGDYALGIQSNTMWFNTPSSYEWYVNSTTPVMYLNSIGLSIGTTNQANKLDVNGGAAIGTYAGVNAAGSGNLIVSGSVGIGTTSPSVKLHVAGGSAIINGSHDSITGPTTWDNAASNGEVAISYDTTNNNGRISSVHEGTSWSPLYFQAGQFDFTTGVYGLNSTPSLMINSSGNVGIGTTSPNEPLDINGYTQIENSNALFISGGSGNPFTTGKSYGQINWDSVNTALSIQAETTSTAYRNIELNPSGGNVGIGTPSPQAVAHIVAGSSNSSILWGLMVNNTDNTNGIGSGTGIEFKNALFQNSTEDNKYAGIAGVDEGSYSQLMGLAFYTPNGGAPAERMRISAAGNVGIGTTNPQYSLDVNGYINGRSSVFAGNTNNNNFGGLFAPNFVLWRDNGEQFGTYWLQGWNTAVFGLANNSGSTIGAIPSGDSMHMLQLFNSGAICTSHTLSALGTITTPTCSNYLDNGSGNASFAGSVGIGLTSPAATLNVNGSLLVDATALIGAAATSGYGFQVDSDTNATVIHNGSSSGSDFYLTKTYNGSGYYFDFLVQGTGVGTIYTNGSTTAYNTSSDRRLKENIAPTVSGLDKMSQVQVDDFNFIADKDKTRVQGFIAQDLYKVYPEAVTVGGDDPKTHPWSVDYGRLTPLLVKSIQELKADNDNLRAANDNEAAQIKALTARLDALEAARH